MLNRKEIGPAQAGGARLTPAAPDRAIGVLFDVSTRIVVRWLVEGAHAVTAKRVSFVVSTPTQSWTILQNLK